MTNSRRPTYKSNGTKNKLSMKEQVRNVRTNEGLKNAKKKLVSLLQKTFAGDSGHYLLDGQKVWRFSTGTSGRTLQVRVSLTQSEWRLNESGKLKIDGKSYADYLKQIPKRVEGFAVEVASVGAIVPQRRPASGGAKMT